MRTAPDVLCIQEHKLRQGSIDLLREVWTDGHFVTAPAKDGENARRNNRVKGGKGGVAMGIRANLQPYIITEGILPSNWGVYVTMKHPKFGDIGFLGVYAPNESKERAKLWKEMTASIDINYKWFVMGDYNMIERPTDQKGGNIKVVAGRERRAWNLLARKFHLMTLFGTTNGI
jgi:exonuclease III